MLLLVLGLVGSVALVARLAHGVVLRPGPGVPQPWAWASTDPDGQYHMRRLERALEQGGRVAGRDPRLDAPRDAELGGAAVPWPPYATQLLWLAAAPFAPEEPERRAAFVESLVGRWPLVCGVGTVVLVAFLARGVVRRSGSARLTGAPIAARGERAAVLVAGLLAALPLAALRVSGLGNGDHHAFLTLLHVALAGGLASSIGVARAGRGRVAVRGVLLGLTGALALGSWSASLPWLGMLDLCLWIALPWPVPGGGVLERERAARALGRLGVWTCAAGAVGLVPAVLGSAWGARELLEPSWLQVGLLAAGAVVHLPVARHGRRGGRASLALAVVAVGLLVALAGARELDAGLAWAGGRDPFMAWITESQAVPLTGLGRWVGHGVWLLPLAAGILLVRGWRRADATVLPWVLPLLLLVPLALQQRRFGEALVPFLSLVVGAGLAGPLVARSAGSLARGALVSLAFAVLALGSAPGVLRTTLRNPLGHGAIEESDTLAHLRGVRELALWLREHGAGPDGREPLVLAQWDLGHTLEWVGRARTVASNFGSYLGRESYEEPWRVLLAEDDEEVLARLRARGVTHLVLTSRWTRNLPAMEAALDPERVRRWTAPAAPGEEGWRGSLAARLSACAGADVADAPGYLRLVHLSPRGLRDRSDPRRADPPPHGWVWQVVEGVWLELQGAPGEELRVRARVPFPEAGHTQLWSARARVGENGLARLRVPYPEVRWECVGGVPRSGVLQFQENQLRDGGRVRIPLAPEAER